MMSPHLMNLPTSPLKLSMLGENPRPGILLFSPDWTHDTETRAYPSQQQETCVRGGLSRWKTIVIERLN